MTVSKVRFGSFGRLACSYIGPRSGTLHSLPDILSVDVESRLTYATSKVLYLVCAILISQKVDDILEKMLGITSQGPPRSTNVSRNSIESSGVTAQVRDNLLIGWQISFG